MAIDGLLREWAELAGSCSTFGDYVEDYLHALGTRDILLDVMLAAEGLGVVGAGCRWDR